MLELLLSFGAGVLTVFNPCVLPVLPLVLAGAQNGLKFGIFAFAIGMVSAYALAAVFIVSIGISLNISPEDLRQFAAWALLIFGAFMVFKFAGEKFALFAQPIAHLSSNLTYQQNSSSLLGQFILGALTGLIWAPCSGPTLGAAIALAANSESRAEGILLMAMFAFGAVATLLLFGTVLRGILQRNAARFHATAAHLKYVLGLLCIFIAVLILTKLDKIIEAYLNNNLPNWWVDFTTFL